MLGLPSLDRGVSFKTKKTKTQSRFTISCSDRVGRNEILTQLRAIKTNPDITYVRAEDLITSQEHRCLLPVMKGLIASRDDWEHIRFVDSVTLL